MNRCPITYELCGDQKYSEKGLHLLSKHLDELNDFPYTSKEQLQLASQAAAKLSIQGIQPKLSVKLSVEKKTFEVVEKGGRFILKAPNPNFDELPQNEDLTMRLAQIVGIEVPLHGMIYAVDGSLSYVIRRFDRVGKKKKVATEDFAQLLGLSRDAKYESSMEQVALVIERYCTFPATEKLKLFRLVMFNFLVGNEDMHLKNFTLIKRHDKVELSPAYDLINSTIIINSKEEVALPIRGKKNKLTRKDFVDYFAFERLGLTASLVKNELEKIQGSLESWKRLIEHSFLSKTMQENFQALVIERWQRMSL